jgi:hypothetical protein
MRDQTAQFILLLLWQTTASQIPLSDLVYVLGLIVTLVGLLVGFAKVVSKMSHLQSTVDVQSATIKELKDDLKGLSERFFKFQLENRK